MKKTLVACVILGAFLIYSFLHAHPDAAPIVPNTPASSRSSSSPASAITASPKPEATAAPGALYKDGTYTGSVADAQWGEVQVKAVIQQGKITDVEFLQYPHDRNRSVNINSYADPQLSSEAIQAQSAQVDIVTGATDTSEAFIQSLTDALSQAQNH